MLPMQEGPVSILVHNPQKNFLKKKKKVQNTMWEAEDGKPVQAGRGRRYLQLGSHTSEFPQ